MEKVFREDDFAASVTGMARVAAARNEYVSFQLVVEAPWRHDRRTNVVYERLSASFSASSNWVSTPRSKSAVLDTAT